MKHAEPGHGEALPEAGAGGVGFKMPTTAAMLRELIETDHYTGRSKMRQFPIGYLVQVAAAVIDPTVDQKQTLAQLWDQHGADAISKSSFYRWAKDLRQDFTALRKTYRSRQQLASIDGLDGSSPEQVGAMLKAQAMNLALSRLVAVEGLDELKGGELSSVVSMIDNLDRDEMRGRELQLRERELQRREQESDQRMRHAEQRAEKLDAEIALLRQRHAQLPERLKALQTAFDQLAKQHRRGEALGPQAFAAFGDQLRQAAAEFNAQEAA